MLVPTMTPLAGERLLRHLGDRVTFTISWAQTDPGWNGFLRTNLGRARRLRAETIAALGGQGTFAGGSWRDIPMHHRQSSDGRSEWFLDLPMTEIGFFQAKPYLANSDGVQHWPAGSDLGISIQPSDYRTANTIYCAFTRMFGKTRQLATTRDAVRDGVLQALDHEGYTAIPPSGTFRDLAAELPHIVQRLGCRILHLLPVGPTPTTYARYGRFGSPYAQQDLTSIDPALVEFDRRTTAVDQFIELTAAAQRLGCRVFLDIVINHTGWGSTLLDTHPEWFKRAADGSFHSPGAWGNTWEDLVELDNNRPALWEVIAQALIVWCRRGVNGFRCDAGYMVPLPAWQFIICRVRQEFPHTVFLLEGLGGAWEATEGLLTAGGMQWAYSELFQNFSAPEITRYLQHCHGLAGTCGVLVHYSETHDNDRLAKGGRAWSLFRNRLSALTSHAGAYGFTAGVEWLADEKLEVHQSRGMRWGATENIVDELALLNHLLADDPCFFDGAEVQVQALPSGGAAVAVLRTAPADCARRLVLVLANPDRTLACSLQIPLSVWDAVAATCDVLNSPMPAVIRTSGGVQLTLAPLACLCLAAQAVAPGTGDTYRRLRAQAGWAYACLGYLCGNENLGPADWRQLAAWVAADPLRFLAAASQLDRSHSTTDLLAALQRAALSTDLPTGLRWTDVDARRDVPVPCGFWLLVSDSAPFRITLTQNGATSIHLDSVEVDDGHVTALPPHHSTAWQHLTLVRGGQLPLTGRLVRLPQIPDFSRNATPDADSVALLTNGRGGMTRLGIDLGRIHSKYDCLLGANLHPNAPSDRHVLAKRLRIWVNADGFVTALNYANLEEFTAGPPATWRFRANAGDGRTVVIELTADLLAERNTVVVRLQRPLAEASDSTALPAGAAVRMVLRVDVEDRSFHGETQRTTDGEQYFSSQTTVLSDRIGFAFTPASDRRLVVTADAGRYHHETEWCTGIPHPVEADRGMTGQGDARSPGWFDVPLAAAQALHVVIDAEVTPPSTAEVVHFAQNRTAALASAVQAAGFAAEDVFGLQLSVAARAYLVRRDAGRTVIAGYPWFLDWGRDTFIAARGLLAAGLRDDVRQLLLTFGRFEEHGTLPNLLNGDQAENRDTCDAPLWYAVVLEELAAHEAARSPTGAQLYEQLVDGKRSLSDIIRSIACGYLAGTPNGIRVDPQSALVWSPPHFTWMDTNYPACTPRQGYPVEIQVLWIRLLRHLARLQLAPADGHPPWSDLAEQALASLLRFYWLENKGYFADQLIAGPGVPAARGLADDALRPNQIFAVSLGVIRGELARRATLACLRHLAVPGAVRSLAPLPVSVPLDLRSAAGKSLNDPYHPYVGFYTGDEDSKRKPAYHNGTAWTWPFPSLCEALAGAWDHSPVAVAAAKSLLGSMDLLLADGCVGQIPEILDGDSPHRQRGCDAQAWGVTEALRVWKKLGQR